MFVSFNIKLVVVALSTCLLFSACSGKGKSAARKLNDTGITWGGDYPKDINEDCSARFNTEAFKGQHYAGDIITFQDCSNGADAEGEKTPAFVYQKASATGKLLDDKAEVWSCVLDEITGLLWEVKSGVDGQPGNQGLHDGDDLFTWYYGRFQENGGAVGDWNARYNQCSGYVQGQPETYCNTEELLARVNRQGYCGRHNWRIPLRAELESLPHLGRSKPAIHTDYFPYTKENFYWSNTPVVGQPEMAWAVSFSFGYSAQLKRDNARNVRLVSTWSVPDVK